MPFVKNKKKRKVASRQKPKAKPCANAYLKWLGGNGYFAWQAVMGDVAFIFAMRGGKPVAICTGKGSHTAGSATITDFEKAGGRAFCVSSIDDLENLKTMGNL